MKRSYRLIVTGGEKSKKAKKASKDLAMASMLQRYMELRRLRERIFEAESVRNAR